jgi:predicted SprT family Zn-dependent metalloprotease
VTDDSFICQPCQVKLVRCAKCGKPRAESARRCPHCGDELPGAK